jgi:hypothetical protein
MRFLVWDDNSGKLMGIFALGDPVFNLRMRDQLIGWDQKMRRNRLVNVLDAYVLGALPPFNSLLGGKLIACLIRSQEVKDLFASRYRDARGLISRKKKNPNLVLVTTSSSMGRSSVYNRLKLGNQWYFRPVGYTEGWGHFHIPDELFADMRDFLRKKKHRYANNNRFGQGPNWKMRVVRETLSLLGENPDLLCHNVRRELFMCELARNSMRVLRGDVSRPQYRELLTVSEIADLAKDRWIIPRADRMPDYLDWDRSNLERSLDPLLIQQQYRNIKPRLPQRRAQNE